MAIRAEGEEMSAPGPPWTPEEDGLLRSMGAAGESATAIATLLKRKAAASSPTRDQVGPFAARAEAEVEMIWQRLPFRWLNFSKFC